VARWLFSFIVREFSRLALFVDEVAHALVVAPKVGTADYLTACESLVALHAAGLRPKPPRLEARDVLIAARDLQLNDSGAVDDLVQKVYACATYGLMPVRLGAGATWFCELLTGFALQAFRDYDLVLGSRLLRALSYISEAPRACIIECSRYLLLQQRPSGSFGFMGPEVEEVTSAFAEFSPLTDLYLPVTIESIWALGESVGERWRLYSALAELRRSSP
jgi:hypothetical protein